MIFPKFFNLSKLFKKFSNSFNPNDYLIHDQLETLIKGHIIAKNIRHAQKIVTALKEQQKENVSSEDAALLSEADAIINDCINTKPLTEKELPYRFKAQYDEFVLSIQKEAHDKYTVADIVLYNKLYVAYERTYPESPFYFEHMKPLMDQLSDDIDQLREEYLTQNPRLPRERKAAYNRDGFKGDDWDMPEDVLKHIRSKTLSSFKKNADTNPEASIGCVCGQCVEPITFKALYQDMLDGGPEGSKWLANGMKLDRSMAYRSGKTRAKYIQEVQIKMGKNHLPTLKHNK